MHSSCVQAVHTAGIRRAAGCYRWQLALPRALPHSCSTASSAHLLLQIQPPAVRALIMHMIQRDPDSRLAAKDYLTSYGPSLFPEYFTSFLQPFCQTLLPLTADLRLAAVQQAFPQMLHFMTRRGDPNKSPSQAGSVKSSPPQALEAEESKAGTSGRGTPGGGSQGAGGAHASGSASAPVTRPSSANRVSRSGGSVRSVLPPLLCHAASPQCSLPTSQV